MKRLILYSSMLAALAALTGSFLMNSSAQTPAHPHADKLVNDDGSWKYTNALIGETSPYLLQHAHNPVDWRPWGAEAFEEARRLDKPIFLSVGYSTCYWCHVMERQSFENPAIAAIMNEHYVNIKVDREERPDVDDLYMTATQIMTRSGGWPMSVFLTPPGADGPDDPGLKPFYAGTYFPPEPAPGRPGFPQVLEGLSKAWREQRGEVLEQARNLTAAVEQTLTQRDAPGPVDGQTIQDAANGLLRIYDAEHGGFGVAPKFPQPANAGLLLAVLRNNPIPDLGDAIHHTLDRMARGGMYDQVGGGFHRYSTDEKWLVPHFEKMLYDNGQLLSIYADAMASADETQREQYRRVMRETADYVLREMTDETGAFWSAQDAEVNAMEGGNYVWTAQQVKDAIGDAELQAFALKLYGLDRGTNFRDPHHPGAEAVNVLYLPTPLHELGDGAAEKRQQVNAQLKVVRDRRDQPGTDDKVLTAWNGLMIAGLADASVTLDEPRYAQAAARAADAIVEHMSAADGGLYRTMRRSEAKVLAFLEDYAFFVRGLLALHRAGLGDGKYLDWAKRYTDAAIERFAAPGGGYYDTLADQADLLVRQKGVYDGALPSGNSVMAHNLVGLYEAIGDPAYLEHAAADLRSASTSLEELGPGVSHLQEAALRVLEAAPPALRTKLAAPASARPEAGGPVRVRVEPAQVASPGSLTVTLAIEPPYHLNANPASMSNLIPTRLFVDKEDVEIEVDYPEPKVARFAFADEPIAVYEGEVTLKVRVRGDAAGAALMLEYQACDDAACLAPQTVRVPVTFE